jgi:hypothetical protein
MKAIKAFLSSRKTQHVLGAFGAALAAQPLVQQILGGAHVSLTRDLVVSTLVAAAVAGLHTLLPGA